MFELKLFGIENIFTLFKRKMSWISTKVLPLSISCSTSGRKRPLDTPKRMKERREREKERERKVEEDI